MWFCRLHPTSFHSKRQSFCWYLSYTQVSKYKRTSGRCSCMDSHNMGKQCFPIVCENGVARTFVPKTPSSPFLQKQPRFRTFPRLLSFAPLAFPCTLCSATKYRRSCGTCKTSIVGSASPHSLLLLLLRYIASPFLGGKIFPKDFRFVEWKDVCFHSWKDVLLCSDTDLWWFVSNMQPKRSRKNTTCVARKHATSRISHSIQSFSSSAILCFSKYLALFSKTKLSIFFPETNTYLFPFSKLVLHLYTLYIVFLQIQYFFATRFLRANWYHFSLHFQENRIYSILQGFLFRPCSIPLS